MLHLQVDSEKGFFRCQIDMNDKLPRLIFDLDLVLGISHPDVHSVQL